MAYRVGDLIWAKMKGYPHWPARIDLVAPGTKIPNNKFPIFFYGTHETAFMQAKDLCPYKVNKSKYFVSKRVRGFQEGLDEIEKTPSIKYGDKKDDESSNEEEDDEEEEEEQDVKSKDKVTKQEKKEIPIKAVIEKEISPAKRPRLPRKTTQENKEVEQIQEAPAAKKPKVAINESPNAEVVSPRKRGRKPKLPIEEIDKKDEEDEEENVVETPVEAKAVSEEVENEKAQNNDTDDQMSKEEFIKKQLERHQKKKELLKEKKRQEKLEQKKAERLAAEREKELLKRMPTTEQILEKFLYDLKMSLTVEAPDVSRCIRIMGQIQNLDITPDMVQNSTDLIKTVKKIRKYKGNDKVADRAEELYRKLKSFFEVSTTGVNGGDDDETDEKSSTEEQEKPSTEENEASKANGRQTREKSQRVKRSRRYQNNDGLGTENSTVNGALSESQEESLPT